MSAAPAPAPAPQSPLLCDTCSCALIFAGAAAMLVGRCAPCVKRVALAAKPQPPAVLGPSEPRLVWDRSGNVVTAVYGDERAYYRCETGQLVEASGRLPDEAFAELEHDVFGRQHYRGDVPKQPRVPRMSELQDAADHGVVLGAAGGAK